MPAASDFSTNFDFLALSQSYSSLSDCQYSWSSVLTTADWNAVRHIKAPFSKKNMNRRLLKKLSTFSTYLKQREMSLLVLY